MNKNIYMEKQKKKQKKYIYRLERLCMVDSLLISMKDSIHVFTDRICNGNSYTNDFKNVC